MNKLRILSLILLILPPVACSPPTFDLLLRGGSVYDGSGNPPVTADVGISGDRIVFVGDASAAGVQARRELPVAGFLVAPGFIDMHSHAEAFEDYGRDGLPFLYQGITSVVLGLDGAGTYRIADRFSQLEQNGSGLNVMLFVGHGEVRETVMGLEARPPSDAELEEMKGLVEIAMNQGAFGLSSGLFYVPGSYAETEEVIELARVAARFGGIYDTHDRDLGASYQGIGYLNSIREGIEIGEKAGLPVIFSHFNAQGIENYGRAPEGAALIEEARARGLNVAGAQHVYTATQSSLRAYAIPRWAAAGGQKVMLERFQDPEIVRRLDVETLEMLAIRGGAAKILFADPRPELSGRTLAEVASERGKPVPETVREILRVGNAAVMNLDLYDPVNTRYLAQKEWMMTCTDGRTPSPDQPITHPRVFGAFTRKIRLYVIQEQLLGMEFVIRSMTGLAADFLHLPDRGYLREGMKADVAVLDPERIRDRATFDDPLRHSEGTVHVLVNGVLEIEDGKATGKMAGVPLPRPSEAR